MKKKFNQSFEKREKALFAKIDSRRMRRWFNNRQSQIDSKEKIWFIVFTKPFNRNNDWNTKFWFWDSEENIIIGENKLDTHFIRCHRDYTYEKIVLSDVHGDFTIFDYQGKKITFIHTCSIEEEDVIEQKFLDKDLFIFVKGGFIGISDLNKAYSNTPHGMFLEAWNCKLHVDEYLMYVRCEEFFVLFGRSSDNYGSNRGRNTILVGTKRINDGNFVVVDEFYQLMDEFTSHSLSVTETELIISVEVERFGTPITRTYCVPRSKFPKIASIEEDLPF